MVPRMSRRRRRGNPAEGARSTDPAGALHPTLDLHGNTADEAERAAERWLIDHARDGELTVRLITGRGKRSIGPPVLAPAIADLLTRLRGTLVQGYETESAGGVFRVRLIRPRLPSPPIRRPLLPTLPPEIILEAEQALAELGIASTPALVEVEGRRILRERERAAE